MKIFLWFKYITLLIFMPLTGCSVIPSTDSSSKSWVGKPIAQYEQLRSDVEARMTEIQKQNPRYKVTHVIQILSNGGKEYAYRNFDPGNPTCVRTFIVNANGIIEGYRLSGQCY